MSAPPQTIARTLLIAAAVVAAGCGGGKNYLNENDDLRRKVMDLTEANAELEAKATGLEKQLQVEQKRQGIDLPEGLTRPACVGIELDAYTGPYDKDRDGKAEGIRVYLETHDAQGRHAPVVARISATVIAAEPGKDAVTVATQTFDMKQVNAAYRFGFTGVHYTLFVPVDASKINPDTTSLTLRVGLHDALTGQEPTDIRFGHLHLSSLPGRICDPVKPVSCHRRS